MVQVQIDGTKLLWKDLIFIDEWDGTATGKVRRFTEILARVVVGMTEEDIGNLNLDEISQVFEAIQEAGEKLVPPPTESDSLTS